MNHLTAARKGENGGWHYVSLNRRGGHPLGYCADHEPHDTELEARECYARYQRDHIRLDRGPTNWQDCMAGRTGDRATTVRCPNPTKHYADIEHDGYHLVPLCPDHMTVEEAVKALHLDGPAGDAWQS